MADSVLYEVTLQKGRAEIRQAGLGKEIRLAQVDTCWNDTMPDFVRDMYKEGLEGTWIIQGKQSAFELIVIFLSWEKFKDPNYDSGPMWETLNDWDGKEVFILEAIN